MPTTVIIEWIALWRKLSACHAPIRRGIPLKWQNARRNAGMAGRNACATRHIMKSDRLLSALLLLQAHGRMTGRAMAKRLEVSIRTVHRDMDALSAAGVPVFALRGAQGGWRLDEDWRTEVPGLDEAELRALLMSQPRVMGDVRLAAAAESALAKLMASLPAALRERAASIRQRLHVDTS